MTAFRKRTQAQRDAINARAAAYPRPLSAWQVDALRQMEHGSLLKGRAGWGCSIVGKYWQSQTIHALAMRSLCVVDRFSARITRAGRAELHRHPRREPVHNAP